VHNSPICAAGAATATIKIAAHIGGNARVAQVED